jgi:hypothetical protein
LTRAILELVETAAAKLWLGVPVLPVLQPFAAGDQFLNAIGILTRGITRIFFGIALGNLHRLDEHLGVRSLLEGRGFPSDSQWSTPTRSDRGSRDRRASGRLP